MLSKALLNEFHTSVLCNCVFLITFKSGVRRTSTGISVEFKHAEIYNPQNFSRISAVNAANTALSVQPTQTLFHRCPVSVSRLRSGQDVTGCARRLLIGWSKYIQDGRQRRGRTTTLLGLAVSCYNFNVVQRRG